MNTTRVEHLYQWLAFVPRPSRDVLYKDLEVLRRPSPNDSNPMGMGDSALIANTLGLSISEVCYRRILGWKHIEALARSHGRRYMSWHQIVHDTGITYGARAFQRAEEASLELLFEEVCDCHTATPKESTRLQIDLSRERQLRKKEEKLYRRTLELLRNALDRARGISPLRCKSLPTRAAPPGQCTWIPFEAERLERDRLARKRFSVAQGLAHEALDHGPETPEIYGPYAP